MAATPQMVVAYYADTQATLTAWDAALAQTKRNAEISSAHARDRRRGRALEAVLLSESGGGGFRVLLAHCMTLVCRAVLSGPWKNKYRFPAASGLEYPVPAGSDARRKALS
jgi:hypothetical protein